jgi:hypothetical protein
MTLDFNQSISVSKLIKALIATSRPTSKQQLANGYTIGGKPISQHSFSLNESLNCLTYEVERNNGETYLQQWHVLRETSNLPNVKEGFRYYLFSNGKRISKLHLYAFRDCVCLFSRLDYRHIYRSQSYSAESKGLKHHDYRRKIERLLKQKKKLTLYYDGKRTKTAKRLDYYTEQEDYYDELATQRLLSNFSKFY